jgi:murein DD-endopeptidase MepM/ murein hydrolase activator NlpD
MRRRFTGRFKNKVAIVGAVAFMTVTAAVVGTNILSSNNSKEDNANLVDLNELPDSAQNTVQETKVNTVAEDNVQANNYSSGEFGMDNVMDATDEYLAENNSDQLSKIAVNEKESEEKESEKKELETSEEEKEEDSDTNESKVKETAATPAAAITANFQPENKMVWPVSGNVLINYSMDSTVYFATLNQYKYNSALIIQGDVNTKVVSAADGVVEEIYTDEETGVSMKIDLGNSYKAIYGQLKGITVNKGDTISKGSVIGYVSDPTKYYCVEGSNLYFKVTKNDAPVNPLDFLE